VTIRVAPSGDDANDGLTNPVKTLKRAIGLAAAYSQATVIVLASGRYPAAAHVEVACCCRQRSTGMGHGNVTSARCAEGKTGAVMGLARVGTCLPAALTWSGGWLTCRWVSL
jgi:hypothetical protein